MMWNHATTLGWAWSLALLASALPSQTRVKKIPQVSSEQKGTLRGISSRFLFSSPKIVLGERRFPGTGVLGEMNVDGFMDVVFGGTLFFEIGGTFSYLTLDDRMQTMASHRFMSPSKNPTHVFQSVVTGDLNEDHLTDVIGVGSHGGIAIHLRGFQFRKGETRELSLGFKSRHYTPREIDPATVNASTFLTSILRCLDVDGDTHDDLLLAGDFLDLSGRIGSSGLLFFRGDGHGSFARPVVLLASRVIGLESLDVNSDGRLDLLALGDSGRVTQLKAKANGQYAVETWLLTAIQGAEALYMRDVDQDGQVDFVLLAGRPKKDRFELAVYLGLSDGRPGRAWKRSVSLGAGASPVVSWILEDLDGSGYPDLCLLTADQWGRMYLHLFAGEKSRPWNSKQHLALPGRLGVDALSGIHDCLKWEDIDGDGARDLWISPVRRKETGPVGFLYLKSERSAAPPVLRLGTATAAGNKILPRISTTGGLPRLGNQRFALRLGDVPGSGAPYWLWISHVRMDVNLLGMRVKVFPFRTLMARSQGAGVRGGIVRVPLQIPKDKILLGQSLFVQWVFPSKGAKNVLSLARSEALEIRFLPSRRGSDL